MCYLFDTQSTWTFDVVEFSRQNDIVKTARVVLVSVFKPLDPHAFQQPHTIDAPLHAMHFSDLRPDAADVL